MFLISEALRIVSVSLGSSRRDKRIEAEFVGRQFVIERLGTDGSFEKAGDMIAALDGKVAAIGLGGIDLYLVAGKRRWVVRDALKLARRAKVTPIVDGSGLKNTLERATVRYLAEQGLITAANGSTRRPRFLVVSAVDRFGMAETVVELGYEHIFGDLIFALKVPIAVRSMATISLLARTLLPVLSRLPFQMLYPTGEKQEKLSRAGRKWFAWADVIGGDFHFIGRNLPSPEEDMSKPLAGKMIITNTTTDEDVEKLRALGLEKLVTTTPRLDGRSPGTNVMEGVLVALSGKRAEELTEEDYLSLLRQLDWEPRVEYLQR
ncbi:MAG: quinate 5-dehydrogenase [Armatimonadota bacterium]